MIIVVFPLLVVEVDDAINLPKLIKIEALFSQIQCVLNLCVSYCMLNKCIL